MHPPRAHGGSRSCATLLAWGAGLALTVGSLTATPAAAQVQSVIGVVRDTSGSPVQGAEVRVGERRALTSALGAFRIDSLRPGEHALSIRLLGFAAVRATIPIVADGPTEVEYLLVPVPALLPPMIIESRRTGIYGIVGDTAYRAADGARVQLLGRRTRTVMTDSLGRFSFPEASRGPYVVRVTFPAHAERRVVVELEPGEGKELAVLLTPNFRGPSAMADAAAADLGRRLSWTHPWSMLTPAALARAGSMPLCELASIRTYLGRGATNLILNGTTVYREWPIESLCSWSADEVEMVEFGSNVCADETQTIAQRLGIWCGMRTGRSIPRSINPNASSEFEPPRSYIVIWEKR